MSELLVINSSAPARLCSECGGKLLPLLYGKPSQKAIDAANAGLFILAGCMVEENDPTYECRDCGAQF